MKRLTFLHTSATHVETFNALLSRREAAPDVHHVVQPELLTMAQRDGVTPELRKTLDAVLRTAAQDSNVILCTCSTLGAAAETFEGDAKVLRVDRPMLARAAQIGGRVVVLATLGTTLSITEKLLREEAAKVAQPVYPHLEVCTDAWSLFELGQIKAYHQRVAACLERLAPSADVLVLAQASMLGALAYVELSVPVLSSPEIGLEAALELL